MTHIWDLFSWLRRCQLWLNTSFSRLFSFIRVHTRRLMFAGVRGLEYHPLLPTEIRLVKLLNHRLLSFGNPVLCLKTFNLTEELPEYAALSYTWGPAEVEEVESSIKAPGLRPIWVDSRCLDVYPNLFDALCQLASSGHQEYLWIDAICINQNDDTERSSQVAMMDAIYKNASKTTVWLGKESPHTFRATEILAASSKLARQAVLDIGNTGHWPEPVDRNDRSGFHRYGLPKFQEGDWKALEDVYGRRYFGRVWMTQEIALSSQLEILCGRLTFTWGDVAALATFLSLNNSLVGLIVGSPPPNISQLRMCEGVIHAMAMNVTRLRCRTEDDAAMLSVIEKFNWTVSTNDKISTVGSTLFKLLQINSGFAATDLKDKIFSNYGILNHIHPNQDISSEWYAPIYKHSVTDVFSRFCQGLIQETGILHVLTFAGDSFPTDIPGLPSWVPDFSEAHPGSMHGLFSPTSRYAALNASGPRGDAHCTYTIDGGKLHISAYQLSQVVAIGEAWNELASYRVTESAQMLSYVAPTYPYTSQSRTEAFWRTLVLDQDLSSRPASAELGNSFRSYLLLLILIRAVNLLKMGVTQLEAAMAHYTIDCHARMETPAGQFFPTWQEIRVLLIQLSYIPAPVDGSIKKFENPSASVDELVEAARKFEMVYFYTRKYRRTFATSHGHLGCGPISTTIGDSVWIVAGCPSPLILRKVTDESYHVVGEAYVHGIMSGEAISKDVEWESICLS